MKKKIFIIIPVNDAESAAIKDMLVREDVEFAVTNQAWGASWEKLEDGIKETVKLMENQGYEIYGVELQGMVPDGCHNIDHHKYSDDDRSNRKTSIEQVGELIGVQLTRFEEIIAMNDRGYIPEMEKNGIPWEIIQKVRLADRIAQGITEDQEKEAERAISNKEELGNGNLTIVRMHHSKTATVCDRLYGSYKNLLILSDDSETNFYGDGKLVMELHVKFDGWCGGQLPEYGFWGAYGYEKQNEVISFIKEKLA